MARPSDRSSRIPPISLSHRIHTLLHTVRNIAHFEDELCTLLHESERSNPLAKPASDELLDLLLRMPGDEYLSDIEALREALNQKPQPRAKAAAKRATRKAKPLPPVKGRRRS